MMREKTPRTSWFTSRPEAKGSIQFLLLPTYLPPLRLAALPDKTSQFYLPVSWKIRACSDVCQKINKTWFLFASNQISHSNLNLAFTIQVTTRTLWCAATTQGRGISRIRCTANDRQLLSALVRRQRRPSNRLKRRWGGAGRGRRRGWWFGISEKMQCGAGDWCDPQAPARVVWSVVWLTTPWLTPTQRVEPSKQPTRVYKHPTNHLRFLPFFNVLYWKLKFSNRRHEMWKDRENFSYLSLF